MISVLVCALRLKNPSTGVVGGNYYHVKHLLRHLSLDSSIKLIVACDADSESMVRSVAPESVVHYFRKGGLTVLQKDYYLAKVSFIEKPNVVHRPVGQAPLFPVRGRLICTVADLGYLNGPRFSIKRAYKEISIYLTLLRCRRLICISAATRRELADRFGRLWNKKIAVIWHGVERNHCRVSADKKYNARDGYWLTFGHRPNKNVEQIVRAISRSALIRPLMVVGEGEYVNGLRELAEALGVSERVEFVGRLSNAELDEAYQGAIGFVFVSRYEGFGMPVLEAMSYGLPCVLSEIPALAEVGEGCAVYVPLDDVDKLRGAMERVQLDFADYLDFSSRSIVRSSQCTWEKAAELHRELYLDVLK